jgi:hypothetical protein
MDLNCITTDFASPKSVEQDLEQRHEMNEVMPIGRRETDVQWWTIAVGEQVMLAVRLAPIRRARPSSSPCTARTDELSEIAGEDRACQRCKGSLA